MLKSEIINYLQNIVDYIKKIGKFLKKIKLKIVSIFLFFNVFFFTFFKTDYKRNFTFECHVCLSFFFLSKIFTEKII